MKDRKAKDKKKEKINHGLLFNNSRNYPRSPSARPLIQETSRNSGPFMGYSRMVEDSEESLDVSLPNTPEMPVDRSLTPVPPETRSYYSSAPDEAPVDGTYYPTVGTHDNTYSATIPSEAPLDSTYYSPAPYLEENQDGEVILRVPSQEDDYRAPSRHSLSSIVRMAQADHEKNKPRSFLSNLLKPRSSKPKHLPDYPTLDAIHMVGGKANVHKITTFGYGSPEPSERLPFVGEPADVHQSAHHGRPEGNVPLDENSQFELYEEEPGMFSVPDVVNLVVKNKDKKGRIKQIEEQDIARTSHIRYDGSEAEHVQQINQRSHSAANGELIENADISPGEGHHSEKSNKSQKIATDIDGTEKELSDGSDSISTKYPIMAENTLDSKVAKETDSSDEVMEKENAKAAEEGQYENNTEEVNNEETAGITSDADEKQKENEDKPLAETQTCTAEEVPLEPKTPNVTPAFSTEEILVDTSIVNSPSGKSPEEKGASNEKKGKSNVLKKKSKTIKKKSMKKPGAVTLISGKKIKKETFDIAKGTVIKSPADSVSPDKNKETQVILDEKNENESVEISETVKIKNTESTSSEVPISSNIQDADAGVHSKGDQVIETLRALRSEISKIDKESEEKEEEEEKEKTDKNCAKTDKEDKEHINKGSTESEEKEQTEKKENESANQEKSSKEDEKAMEDGKIKVEEDYTSKKEEAKADEEVPKPELKRTRSLVAITAEENFLYVRSQASSRAASPTNEGKDQPPDEDSSNNEQVPESHSQTKEKQSSDGSASKEEAEGRKEDVNQSETRVESNVNQSIPEDGVEGRMTDEKLSGGKVSVEDSGESGVPETQTENVKGNEKTETLKNEVKNADDKETISEKIDVIDNKKEDGVSSPSDKDATNAPSSENAYQKALEIREDVLVEGLEESARSNTKDLADPTRLTRSANDIMMPYHTKPQRATMSAVEVPENAISTVSLSVANSGGMTGAGTRTVGLGDQMQGDRSYFDRFNAPGSLWQKASPYDVKPSKGVYFSEPREYEDYLPREPARPILQRRGSLSKIDMPKPYNDSYYMDDESYRWNSRYKESRGAQTVRIKNEQPRHGILKTTDAKYSDIPRKEDPHQALKDKLQEPIIIASGIVPDNLTYLTSEYQAIYGKVNPNVRPFPNPNTQIGNNNGKNQKNSTVGNNYNNTYDSYNSSNYVKSNNVYNQKNNGVSYGPNTIDSYNAYNANGDRWTGLIAAAQNNRDYLRREKEKFQEAYFDQGMPPAAITAPLVAPQSKNESVFERLHKNRKPEKPPTNSNTSTKKSDLPSKPAQTTNPPAKTGGKTISTTAALITNKDPMDKNPTLNAASNAAVAANAIASATGSNNAKGSDLEGNRKNQQNAGNDVFNRLYQNAPRKKEKDEEGDLLKAPDGNQPADAAIPGKKGAVKKPAANKGKGVANARKTKGDTKIDVPLSNAKKDKKDKKEKKEKKDKKEKASPGLAPDIVVDDVGDPAPIHGHGGNGESSKIPLVLLQGFFRGPGSKSPHHRRPSVSVNEMALPDHLIDVTSVMRGALPVLPQSLAALCLTLNIVVPGLGTMASGWFGICFGRNRLASMETGGTRMTSVLVTGITGLVQLFTVTFFLVGWFWGVAWGILLISISRKYTTFCSEHRSSISGSVNLEMLTVNTR